MDIVVWLRSLGLGKYEAAFRENDIDETVLPGLTHETLKELGVASIGHRVKLLDAIAALRSDASGKTRSVNATTTSSTPSAHPDDRAERRQVTVMFSDLVGSTALSARMDPDEVISAYQKCVAETVARFGGFVAKFMGDGVLSQQADRLIRRHALPRWGKLQASAIARADVKAMMMGIDAPIVANQTLAAVSAIFSWAMKEDILPANPCKLVARNATTSRERVASDTEVPPDAFLSVCAPLRDGWGSYSEGGPPTHPGTVTPAAPISPSTRRWRMVSRAAILVANFHEKPIWTTGAGAVVIRSVYFAQASGTTITSLGAN
jgi:SAM domain (Sterile alpha motif)